MTTTGSVPLTLSTAPLPHYPAAERLSLVVVGHVDHGKSTIIGRLLADTGSLPEGKLEQIRELCARTARPFEYAFLLDALKDERAQGITIDSARVFFTSARRTYVIIDAPGHIEFLKNMVSGAARAEAAFLVIDAREGIQENSRRHGYLMGMLGIRQVGVLINKMDLVGYDQRTYQELVQEFSGFLAQAGVTPAGFIPVSGANGDNLTRRSTVMDWYSGPTALEMLDGFRPEASLVEKPFRMPVQDVYKFTAQGDDRRIIAGTVESGQLAVGDTVVFHPSGKRGRVRTIEGFNRPGLRRARAGSATGFTLEEQIYISRGEVAAREGQPAPRAAKRVAVSLFWLGRQPLVTGRDYILKLGSARVRARLESVERVIDASDLQLTEHKSRVDRHDVADCVLRLKTPVAVDLVDHLAGTSRFVLLDDYEISGGGIVRAVLADGVAAEQVTSRPVGSGAVVWLTGLSGAGKSTIAERVCAELRDRGIKVEHLDGDGVREVFPTGFTREERHDHNRHIAFLASRLEHHGVVVVASFVSPYRESRAYARSIANRFMEVHVATPLEECERRDVKGLYARARRGELSRFTGIDDPYEAPLDAEITIDTRQVSVEEASRQILEWVRGNQT
ncbi:MAG: adenylyl-sulfate kinase [Gemmatimonadales bacterium]